MQEKKKLAIEVDNVQKIYKLYDKPSDRMKEAFGFGKKTKHKLHYALKGVDMKIYQGEMAVFPICWSWVPDSIWNITALKMCI